jgi:uncharacterized membrane protein
MNTLAIASELEQSLEVDQTYSETRPRLEFIDFTRGLVMALMAWDHVSGFWNSIHGGLEGIQPQRNPSLDLIHFMSRFVTHYCAPTFIFLAGTSLALSSARRLRRGVTQLEVTKHILVRGLILVLLEPLVVSPAFGLPWLTVGVISCIGLCLILFSIARRLPPWAILTGSLIVLLNHQWLDLGFIPDTVAWGHYLRVILHEPGYSWPPYYGFYTVIPWIGVMGLGYCFGLHLNGLDSDKIMTLRVPLALTGLASTTLFFLVRYLNGYGNLVPRWGDDVRDWLYVSKYPPSLAFLLWALGGMCLFMAAGLIIEGKGRPREGLPGVLNTFGRTPLFFYLVHLWLYRLRPPGVTELPFFLGIPETLVFWLAGLVVLYYLCRRYEALKRAHPGSILRYI